MTDPSSQRFHRGIKAYRNGESQSANPYSSRSENWDEWNDGWVYAQRQHRAQVQAIRNLQRRHISVRAAHQ